MNPEPVINNATESGVEPAIAGYDDTVEGKLHYYVDLTLYYANQSKLAKTQLKRDFYKAKQRKTNNKMYTLLVRTPNLYNPLMKYIDSKEAPVVQDSETVEAGETE